MDKQQQQIFCINSNFATIYSCCCADSASTTSTTISATSCIKFKYICIHGNSIKTEFEFTHGSNSKLSICWALMHEFILKNQIILFSYFNIGANNPCQFEFINLKQQEAYCNYY